MNARGYVTLIRRNWHLLPYDQLLELLGMTPEQLAFTLREDDYLWIKLGSLKRNVIRWADCSGLVLENAEKGISKLKGV